MQRVPYLDALHVLNSKLIRCCSHSLTARVLRALLHVHVLSSHGRPVLLP
jgi:hypothetical protein